MNTISLWDTTLSSGVALTSTTALQNLQTFLLENEGFKPSIYIDTRGIPTVGYGYALLDTISSGGWEVNPDLFHDLSLISSFSDVTISSLASFQSGGAIYDLLNSLAVASGDGKNVVEIPSIDNQLMLVSDYGDSIQADSLSSDGGWALAEIVLNDLLAPPQTPTTRPDNATIVAVGVVDSDQQPAAGPNTLPLSFQQIALEDMVYHAPGLIGNTLTADISAATLAANTGDWLNAWTDRAEAWYEIGFNSDGTPVNNNPSLGGYGQMYRQLRDAQEFGLYSQGAGWNPRTDPYLVGIFQPSGDTPLLSDDGEEAVTSLRFLQSDANKIETYLGSFTSSAKNKLELGTIQIVLDYRLKQSSGRRRTAANAAEQNQATETADPETGEILIP